jgi:hypothetical protein
MPATLRHFAINASDVRAPCGTSGISGDRGAADSGLVKV